VHAGIDWLTITLPAGSKGEAEWRNKGIRALEAISEQGNMIKPRGMLGYYGVSSGNCFVGQRERDSMQQYTGYHADMYFDKIYRTDAHVSRIDVQVTVKTVERHD